jgi:hypothetical protein
MFPVEMTLSEKKKFLLRHRYEGLILQKFYGDILIANAT